MAEGRRPTPEARDRGYSEPTVDVRLIRRVGLVLGAVILLVVAAAFALHAFRVGGPDDRFGPAVSGETVRRFPEPRLQSARTEERERYFAEEKRKASEYGWVDRGKGIVRIPVERAMSLLEMEGREASSDGGKR